MNAIVTNIRWSENETNVFNMSLVEKAAKSANMDTGYVRPVDFYKAASEAQMKLPASRRKDEESLRGWCYRNKDKTEVRIQAWFNEEFPQASNLEILEDALRPEDIALVEGLEARFRVEVKSRLSAAREELLAEFRSSLTVELKQAREEILESAKAAVKVGMHQLADIQVDSYSTKPVEKHLPRVLLIGVDSSQKAILQRDYSDRLSMKFALRTESPKNLGSLAEQADKVFFLVGQMSGRFQEQLGTAEYCRVNGGISTLKPLLNSYLAEAEVA